jgi:hypothetical protein
MERCVSPWVGHSTVSRRPALQRYNDESSTPPRLPFILLGCAHHRGIAAGCLHRFRLKVCRAKPAEASRWCYRISSPVNAYRGHGSANVTVTSINGLRVYTTYLTGSLSKFSEAVVDYLFWLRDRTRGRLGARLGKPFACPLGENLFNTLR